MNENEAIERIKSGICCERGTQRFCKDACMYGVDKCAYSMAIKALKEIQQYRALGTVEELREAKEKQIAETPEVEGDGEWNGQIVYDTWICPRCGQHIDRSELE